MNCIRCEMLRVKLRALFMFHVQGRTFDDVASELIADPAYSGVYWLKGDRINRSPTMELFCQGVGVEVVKLNRS